jgi:hypothetical protein
MRTGPVAILNLPPGMDPSCLVSALVLHWVGMGVVQGCTLLCGCLRQQGRGQGAPSTGGTGEQAPQSTAAACLGCSLLCPTQL